MHPIILFDGNCNLCNFSVQFIIKRDPNHSIKFASLQSEVGTMLKNSYRLDNNIDSIVFIENNRAHIKSSAALRICKYLKGLWKVFVILLIIPKQLRDLFYDYISTSRYKWFGKSDRCMAPTEDSRERFLK